jgi:transposase-like protein
MDVVSDHSQASLLSHIQKSVIEASKIKTDGFKGYNNLIREEYTHKVVYSPKMLSWVHILISNAKTFILGTYHGVSKRHLGRYLSEYCYRFNRRFWESQLFERLLNAVINACPVTYAELTQ